jgi:signal transduction histidine kinase/CheY-like chemotaxis protein/HPt (histidine-containing phosphotransfer) domain-containing protein
MRQARLPQPLAEREAVSHALETISPRSFQTVIAAFAMLVTVFALMVSRSPLAVPEHMAVLVLILVQLALLELMAVMLRRFFRRQRLGEKLLRESEQFARSTVDALATHIAIMDGNGVVLATNRAWREFGATGGQTNDRVGEGSNYLALCDELSGVKRDSRSAAIAAGIRDVASGKQNEFALEYTLATSSALLSFLARVTRFPDGAPVRLVVAHEDTTRQKMAEEEVKRAKEDAELANMAKSSFLANTSHEIRTPMNAILGYAEMLLERSQGEQERMHCVRTIRRNGQHLLAIINDILDISKIEAQKLSVERIECSLPQLIGDVVATARPWAMKKGLDFEIRFDELLPQRIRTDPVRTRQVLLNLVSNAIKFTERGKIQVGVHREISYFAHTIRFEINDTGIGMTREQLSRLFQPFTQADASTTRKFGGTGLGLTISKRLAKLLGGDIECRSEAGVGTTFIFRVDGGPRAGVPLVERLTLDGLPAANDDVPSTGEGQLQGRVLLAEDGEDNRDLIASHLYRAGLEVGIAATGRVAVEAAQAEHFDLVLMDMQMPEMDGYEATRVLREAGFNMPIIAVTAHAMAEDRHRCIHAGCTDYLSKPISRSELLQMLRRYLSRDPAPPADHSVAPTLEANQTQVAAPESSNPAAAADGAMAQLVIRFIGKLPERVTRLQALLRENDLENLKQAVHQLRGAAGGYGFPEVTESAAQAERSIRDGQPIENIRRDLEALIEMVRGIGGYNREHEPASISAADSAPSRS